MLTGQHLIAGQWVQGQTTVRSSPATGEAQTCSVGTPDLVDAAVTAADHPTARLLLAVLERKAGRVLVNGFPTGVEVCEAMVHGGPCPASTNFGATPVGTMSTRR